MTNAEARFNKSLRPRKPEGSLGRTAQDVHLDSPTAPELCADGAMKCCLMSSDVSWHIRDKLCCRSTDTSTETRTKDVQCPVALALSVDEQWPWNSGKGTKQKTSNLLSPAPPPYSWSLLGKIEGPAPPPSFKISWSFDLAWNPCSKLAKVNMVLNIHRNHAAY